MKRRPARRVPASTVSPRPSKRARRGSSAASAPWPPAKHLLVPVDFAPASIAAVQHAVYLAERFGARVDLLYVEPVAVPADVTQLPIVLEHEQHRKRAQGWLAKLAAGTVPAPVRGRVMVRSGAPYHEIARFAEAQKVDLIVMPTHGYTGLKHVLLGSTTERVIRHAPCPVLTLRVRTRAAAKLHQIRRVLVPVDFSDSAQIGVSCAVTYAEHFQAQLIFCHVIEPPNYPQFGYAHVAMIERTRRAEAEKEMEKLRRKIPAEFRIRRGTAHEEIVAEAVRSKADLVVLATHGRSGLAHILVGSTAERVVRHANCPVLVVRARK